MTFTSYQALHSAAIARRDAIRKIEATVLTVNPRDVGAWQMIERLAADYASLVAALEDWLAADARELDQQIENCRTSLRDID